MHRLGQLAITVLFFERNVRPQKIAGRDGFYVVVLGGGLNGQQVKLVEGALDLALRLIVDPQGFNGDVLKSANVLVQVVEAVVGPGDGQAIAKEVFFALIGFVQDVGVTHIDRRLSEPWLGEVPGHAGQRLATTAGGERMAEVFVEHFLTPARRGFHLGHAQVFVDQAVLKAP
ncbi:hypothetical protein D3C86_1309200 [compost metagenome]